MNATRLHPSNFKFRDARLLALEAKAYCIMKDFGQMIRTRKALEAWRTAANERTLREPKLVDENLTGKKLI